MGGGEDDDGEDCHEEELQGHHSQNLQPLTAVGVEEEDKDIDDLDEDAGSIDGHHQGAVWMHIWQSIQNPHHAVHQRGHVWYRRVLLHCPFLPYPYKR